MTIDLLAIEPHKISRDLKGKIVTIYGEPKVGKTTIASKFPNALLLAFEKGYNALSGVYAQPINKWSDFKMVLRQLEKPAVQERYGTIVIDTADLAYEACEKYICQREGVDHIGDIAYGKGWSMVKKEFHDALRTIPMLGYGLVMISHSNAKTFTDENGTEFTKTVPTLPNTPRHVVLSMSDIIGYAKPVEENGKRVVALFLRGTPQFEAGSRFKYVPPVIPFEYDALVDAIADAIEKEEEEKAGSVTNESVNFYAPVEERPFEELKAETEEVIAQIINVEDESEQQKRANEIKKIIENHLGKGRKLKDTTEEQRDHIELILMDLQDILNN